MRRLSAALVALCAAVALSALSAPAWAATPESKSDYNEPKSSYNKSSNKGKRLIVDPKEVRSGQKVKVSGGGCRGKVSITVVIKFFIDGEEFHRGKAKRGGWTYEVKLPSGLRSGEHELVVECRGGKHRPAKFHVKKRPKGSFNVWPDTVIGGDKVWADGNGCKPDSPVWITLNGKVVKRFFADEYGNFDKKVRIPKFIRKGRHVVSAFCGFKKRHLGSDGIKVKKTYKQKRDKVYFDKNVVKPGEKLRIKGDDCEYGDPSAYLDEDAIELTASRKGKDNGKGKGNGRGKGKGFSGEVTIPKGTEPGKHTFYAGCEDGSWGYGDLDVLDEDEFEEDAARQAFGSERPSDLAMWAGLFAGIALLVASTIITTRRRRNHR
jgi:hypothetical protein